MVTMYLENKYEVSLRELVRVAKDKGGIPSRITVDLKEALGIIEELKLASESNRIMNRNGFCIKLPDITTTQTGNVSTVNTFRVETFNTLGIPELISQWTEGKMSITFDGVPLQIVER